MAYIQRKSPSSFHPSRRDLFTHQLQHHPLLQFEELKKLALRHPTVKFHSAHIPRTQSLETVVHDHPPSLDLRGALDNIHSSGTFVFIQNIQTDPVYGRLVNEMMEEIEKDVTKSHRKIRNRQAWVFITSPGGTTPYHRDQESSHYFHIKGKKTFWLWDANDREVVSQEENEYFHGVYGLSKTKYREELMDKASEHIIHPGDGIYFPYTAPHMVQNGSEEYSISISFTHMSEEDFQVRRINKMNQLLRKAGLKPRDLGQSQIVDQSKLLTHAILRNVMSKFQESWKNA